MTCGIPDKGLLVNFIRSVLLFCRLSVAKTVNRFIFLTTLDEKTCDF